MVKYSFVEDETISWNNSGLSFLFVSATFMWVVTNYDSVIVENIFYELQLVKLNKLTNWTGENFQFKRDNIF